MYSELLGEYNLLYEEGKRKMDNQGDKEYKGRNSIEELLAMPLVIPPYQRPYKWDKDNIISLLTDIEQAIADKAKFGDDYRYRIGTIIFHREKGKDDKETLNVVDGQQRIISLALMKKCLIDAFTCSVLEERFTNPITRQNIHDNYLYMRNWFSLKTQTSKKDKDNGTNETKKLQHDFLKAFKETLEVIVLVVDDISEAFQLFDSQNNRGKPLDPHDYLKAYHLRAIQEYPREMRHAVTKWERHDTAAVRELFADYLYPICNWYRGIKPDKFNEKHIDMYKGIEENSPYYYAKRASKAMPFFQITEPFIAGNDFFEYVNYHLTILSDIEKALAFGGELDFLMLKVREKYQDKQVQDNTGFMYAYLLFKCALFCYYDRFHNFDKAAVIKLFTWAMMLRVNLSHLGMDSINKYAVGGEGNKSYTLRVDMFSKIVFARTHHEIANLELIIRPIDGDRENWKNLYDALLDINGLGEA